MRAPLSIVIPTLNAEDELPETLASLMEGLPAGIIRELVISDGGSEDNTRKIAQSVGAVWCEGPASRGGQLKRGCAAAKGSWLLLLHADTRLSQGWSDVVAEAMHAGEPGYFRLAFRSTRSAAKWVAGWANLRARLFGLPYGDQGLLISRAMLENVGGVPDQPLMEDVALARALKGQLYSLPAAAQTSFDRYAQEGVLRRGAKNLWLLTRYMLGAKPETLARRYRARRSQ